MRIRVIDTETTGLPPDCKIVEIATVDLVHDGTQWARDRTWTTLVNPGVPIPPEASAIHHITDEMVADAITHDSAVERAVGAGAGELYCAIVAHEAKFEQAVLPETKGMRWICTRKCAATLWPDAPNHKNQTLRYWLKLKLADESLALPHRALGDAYVTAAILRRMLTISDMKPEDRVAELLDISSKPVLLQKFTFGKHAMQMIEEVPTNYLEWIVDKSQIEDEDVRYTAQQHLMARRAAQFKRDPLQQAPQQ